MTTTTSYKRVFGLLSETIFICWLFFTLSLSAAEKVDLLIAGGTVVTMDEKGTLLENGAIAVSGDKILSIGPTAGMQSRFHAKRTIAAKGRLILPGLINTHNHAAMTLLRGIADDLPLMEWLQQYIFPVEAGHVDAEFVRWGTLLACAEMIRTGTTTFADMYYFEDKVAEAAKLAGMRVLAGETILDFPAPDHKTTASALAWTESFLQRWQNDPLVHPSIAPHAVYTVSPEHLKACTALAAKYQAPLQIHISETRDEQRQIQERYKTSPTRHMESLGILNRQVIAAHCVWVDEEDMALLKKRDVGVAHNPESNMKLGSGVAPIARMLQLGLHVGLGTDGPASNNDLNLWDTIDLTGKLQKLHLSDPSVLPAEQVVRMATISGARALHMEDQIGSLEVGKKADIILLETGRPHLLPRYNIYSHLANVYEGSDVSTTIIGGKVVYENGRILTLDEPAILAKAKEFQSKIAATLNKQRS